MREITPNEIRKIQTKLLVDFAEFCDENGLYYTIGYGTLIGAIRHKGFIPWDDDIDVIMPRPDYEKFLELSKHKKIDPNIDTISYKLGNSTYPFTKLIDNRTEVEEKFVHGTKIGVWIDVFALDGNFSNDFLNMLHHKAARFIRKTIEIKRNDFGLGTTKSKQILKSILYPITKLFSYNFLCLMMDKICCIKSYEKSRYIGGVVWGYGSKDRTKKELFMKSINVEFEGHLFKAPSNYDKYLRGMYGDYMRLPPENKRIRHDFNARWKQ